MNPDKEDIEKVKQALRSCDHKLRMEDLAERVDLSYEETLHAVDAAYKSNEVQADKSWRYYV